LYIHYASAAQLCPNDTSRIGGYWCRHGLGHLHREVFRVLFGTEFHELSLLSCTTVWLRYAGQRSSRRQTAVADATAVFRTIIQRF
jgi:hypothetical protein